MKATWKIIQKFPASVSELLVSWHGRAPTSSRLASLVPSHITQGTFIRLQMNRRLHEATRQGKADGMVRFNERIEQ